MILSAAKRPPTTNKHYTTTCKYMQLQLHAIATTPTPCSYNYTKRWCATKAGAPIWHLVGGIHVVVDVLCLYITHWSAHIANACTNKLHSATHTHMLWTYTAHALVTFGKVASSRLFICPVTFPAWRTLVKLDSTWQVLVSATKTSPSNNKH